MGKCQLCKREIDLPFKCSYCGQFFCAEHRLPENHLCPSLPKGSWHNYKKIKKNKEKQRSPTSSKPKKPLEPIPIHGLKPRIGFNWRLKEPISTISKMFIVSGVGLYAINYLDTNYIIRSKIYALYPEETGTIIGFSILMILVFCHELLHTMAWRHFGYDARIILVTPMFGFAKGTKPRNFSENMYISLAPLILTITAILFSGYTVGFSNEVWMDTTYFFWGFMESNRYGMGLYTCSRNRIKYVKINKNKIMEE